MSKRKSNRTAALSSAVAVIEENETSLPGTDEILSALEVATPETLEVLASETDSPEVAEALRSIPSETEVSPETETPSDTSAPVASAPVVKDPLGYGVGTETSFILAGILAGNATRAALLSAFLARFAGEDAEEIRRKKTTFSVFFSDVKRPIGTYHASRGLVLVEADDKTISVSPDSLAASKKAIDAGILAALRGVNPKSKPSAYAKILASFGLSAK